MAIVCWPAALFCGCCATETGKKYAVSKHFILHIDELTRCVEYLAHQQIRQEQSVMLYLSSTGLVRF